MRILLIDDDEIFCNLLKAKLTEQRYIVDIAADGQEGWDYVEAQDYDLIVLDVMLPKVDGISFCRRLRAKGLQVLIMLLTSRSSSNDKIIGLDAGADDYVVKSIPLPELEARIRALLRRQASSVSPILEWGNLRLDPSTSEVTYGGVVLNFTAKEYALLDLLLRNAQKIHSQNSILNQLWSLEDEPPGTDTVRTLIKRLRHKFKVVGAADIIETVYGLGYRLNVAFQKVVPDISQNQPKKENQLNTKNIWEENKSKLLAEIVILEQANEEFLKNSLNSHRQIVKQQAHKLIGSFRIFNLHQGSEIARKIEEIFNSDVDLDKKIFIKEQIKVLHTLVESLTPEGYQKKTATLNYTNAASNLSEGKTRLLIVDEDKLFIDKLVVEATTRGIDTAIAPNIQLALDAIKRVHPDVVILDMSILHIEQDILKILDELSKQKPPIPVLLLDNPENTIGKFTIARRKCRGLLQKNMSLNRLLDAVIQTLKPIKVAEAKVMVVDDDRLSLRLVQTLLEPWGLQVNTLSNPLQFWDELEAAIPDLLILDVQMPDIDGIELCQMIRNDSRWAWIPILFLTGDRNSDTIQQVFSAGADDYISKPVVAPELINRIFNRLERTRLLREYAENDSLTGIPNRHRSCQDIERLLHLARQYQQPLCLAVITLDNLTQINRNYGHRLGDKILRRFAQLLQQELRSEDIVARWDGAEFIVAMYGIVRGDGVEWLAEILELLRQIEFLTPDGKQLSVTFSAGLTQFPEDGSDIPTLYQIAGATSEKSKLNGGNRVFSSSWQPLQSHPVKLIDVVLLHQDSEFAASIMEALTTRGYHANWLQDGQTALKSLTGNNPSLYGRVILLEDNFCGFQGFDLLKHLKKDKVTQHSKILWLSTKSHEVENALNSGCFDYINLPCNISAFMHRLRRAMEN